MGCTRRDQAGIDAIPCIEHAAQKARAVQLSRAERERVPPARTQPKEAAMSNSIHQDVGSAIKRSIDENRIVTITALDSAEHETLCRILFEECEDTADNGAVTEYWGIDLDGNEWRVHVKCDWLL
jgi:hypothetical protein